MDNYFRDFDDFYILKMADIFKMAAIFNIAQNSFHFIFSHISMS